VTRALLLPLVLLAHAASAEPVARYRATLGHAPVSGPADAKVTIVVWADYQCPFCARLEPVLAELRKAYPRLVRVAWRQQPLSNKPNARLATEAALAAHDQGRFWEMNALLFARPGGHTRDALDTYAQELGLDADRFHAAIDGHQHDEMIDEDSVVGARIGALATPTLFVNGRVVHGYESYETLDTIIKQELRYADSLIAKGTARARLYDHILAKALARAPGQEGADADDGDEIFHVEVGDSPVRGASSARVTVIEFGDFQCPFCSRAEATLAELRKRYGRKLRLVWKDFPSSAHPQSLLAAEAARAAGDQGKFWPMHDWLLAAAGALDLTSIETQAEAMGLDMARFRKTLDAWQHRPAIDRDVEAGQRIGTEGTPTFLINGRKLSGAQPLERFEEAIDRALGE
jgi:protein-disulfide isomerase